MIVRTQGDCHDGFLHEQLKLLPVNLAYPWSSTFIPMYRYTSEPIEAAELWIYLVPYLYTVYAHIVHIAIQ